MKLFKKGDYANMKERFKNITYKIENNFFLTVIRHALTMMIPLLLIGGIACALMNLPFVDYSNPAFDGLLGHVYNIFHAVYFGTFGIFSLTLAILLSLCYAMERNQAVDKVALYIVVTLGAYGTQLNIGSPNFCIDNIGIRGSFSAMFAAMLSCFLFEQFRKISALTLKKYALGMEGICANAVQTILPMGAVIAIMLLINESLYFFLGVYSIHELFSNIACSFFDYINNNFASGLLYTFLLHLLWICGFHGSHLLEPVAQTTFAEVSSDVIFSKSFFDTYIVMGGCGTTICVLIILLIFYRKERMGTLAKISFSTVIFNLNEVLNFGIPIILNPIFLIPFIMTPILCYCISYGATALGIVPKVLCEIPWSTPILISGYMATGSISGSLLQLVCIFLGCVIYFPFIRLHNQMQEIYAKEKLKRLIAELQNCEQDNENPQFLTRSDSLGLVSRMLLEDLKLAIKHKKLYMLYQPQMDNDGHCIGAEALLRWEHPLYGFIYPPLIIYLAKEGDILPDLDASVFDMASDAIRRTSDAYNSDFKISVNITAKSLLWDIEAGLDECIQKYDIPAERLWIEITEQDVISKADSVIDKLKRLKNLGHTLLIDDFGMGHTSLKYLQSSYFGVVKLDGSLVKNLLESKTNQKIVASIVNLGNNLDVKVLAEYVEDEPLLAKLKELGCHWYQGYYYSKPIPLDDFIAYIKKTNQA